MAIITKSVSVFGTEKEFIKKFVEEVTAADSRIVCNTDMDEMFDNTSNIPEFQFIINEHFGIKFKRKYTINNQANDYNLIIIINGNEYAVSAITFSQSSIQGVVSATRCWNFKVLSHKDLLGIWFSNHQTSMQQGFQFNGISVSTDNKKLFAYSTTSAISAMKSTFYDNNGLAFSFYDRLNYEIDEEKIEIIKNKILLNGNKKQYQFNDFFDCSIIPQFSRVTVDEKNYYAVDSNTLILLDNEEEENGQ